MKRFKLDDIQAQAILDMRLQRLTGLEREKIVAEYEETLRLIARLKEILASEQVLKGVIIEELKEVRETYAGERRTFGSRPARHGRQRPGGGAAALRR
jgi:DNA gyrase subunit A